MTTNAVRLELEPRQLMGKKVGQLRRAGIIPVHLYGPGIESRALQCGSQRLIQALSIAGGNTPINITVTGESETHLAFAREIQWDPKRDDVLHVDLLAADVSRPVTAQVPVVLSGDSPGARSVSGTVLQVLREIQVQALPLEIPAQIDIDLNQLTQPDSVVRVSDINLPSEVTVLSDTEEVLVRIELPRVDEPVEVGEGVEESEEAPSQEEEASEE